MALEAAAAQAAAAQAAAAPTQGPPTTAAAGAGSWVGWAGAALSATASVAGAAVYKTSAPAKGAGVDEPSPASAPATAPSAAVGARSVMATSASGAPNVGAGSNGMGAVDDGWNDNDDEDPAAWEDYNSVSSSKAKGGESKKGARHSKEGGRNGWEGEEWGEPLQPQASAKPAVQGWDESGWGDDSWDAPKVTAAAPSARGVGVAEDLPNQPKTNPAVNPLASKGGMKLNGSAERDLPAHTHTKDIALSAVGPDREKIIVFAVRCPHCMDDLHSNPTLPAPKLSKLELAQQKKAAKAAKQGGQEAEPKKSDLIDWNDDNW